MNSFIIKEQQQLHELGLLRYIVKKLRSFFSCFIMVLFFLLYLVIRIIRPLKLIRFGSLRHNRIGHFAGNNEIYLCEKEHGLQPVNSLDIFYCPSKSCNNQLLIMWKRVLRVNRVAAYFIKINNIFPGGDIHKIQTTCSDRDIFGLLDKSKTHLSFTNNEIDNAKLELKEMSIQPTNQFVCIAGRDPKYLNKVNEKADWSYHNYRDSNIQNYVMACEELSRKGYYVIRMGAEVQETMNTNDPRIIELAFEGYRTELLDIYLSAKCKFFINGESGFGGVPRIFRRPLIMVNIAPLEYILSWASNIISILKKFWLIKEKRVMTFKEIYESGAGRFLRTDQYVKMGIELIENTPDEILDVSMEMHRRLNGTWEITEEDESLQKCFWNQFPKSELHGELRSRIGTEFLRQNKRLLT